jgi:hypothetical protein
MWWQFAPGPRSAPGGSSAAAENGDMGAYVVGVLLALAAAAAVMVVASRGSDERTGWRTFLADFRAGWRDRKNDEPEPEPVDVRFDELFATESRPGDDYLHLDEFAEMIERTGDRAERIWHRESDGGSPERGPWTLHPRGHRGGPRRTGSTDHPASDTAKGAAPRRTSISSQH